MKRILFFAVLFFAFGNVFAQDVTPKLYPVVDDKVMYERVVEVPGVSKELLYVKSGAWIIDKFKTINLVVTDLETGQHIYKVQTEVVNLTLDLTVQIDVKDNKYRVRFYDIRHSITGKSATAPFAEYIVNVHLETDNSIVKGEGKYSKGQRKAAQKDIITIDEHLNSLMDSLRLAVLKPVIEKKADDF